MFYLLDIKFKSLIEFNDAALKAIRASQTPEIESAYEKLRRVALLALSRDILANRLETGIRNALRRLVDALNRNPSALYSVMADFEECKAHRLGLFIGSRDIIYARMLLGDDITPQRVDFDPIPEEFE
jgi:hypothetical protein